jgi:hypothetical protein
MNWNTFVEAMPDPTHNHDTWDRMAQADCLIGGIDHSLSYMYVETFAKADY